MEIYSLVDQALVVQQVEHFANRSDRTTHKATAQGGNRPYCLRGEDLVLVPRREGEHVFHFMISLLQIVCDLGNLLLGFSCVLSGARS